MLCYLIKNLKSPKNPEIWTSEVFRF